MIAAGVRYFVIVFAVAFALGTIRTLWVAPAIGATAAVLVELPLVWAASVAAAHSIVQRAPAMTRRGAIATGAFAFGLLMAAEAALAVFLFGMSIADWAAALVRLPGTIGLAGQLVFALMPLIVREWGVWRSSPPRQR